MASTAPSTNAATREERILARRARIAAKKKAAALAAARAAGEGDAFHPVVDEVKDVGKGQKQVNDSQFQLRAVEAGGTDRVTSIRVASDARENRRRAEEETVWEARHDALMAEAQRADTHNAAIALKWDSLRQFSVPQALQMELDAQRQSCESVIDSKNELISEMQLALAGKDNEYKTALTRQIADIKILVDRMGEQISALRDAYFREMDEIERAFMQERKELLDGNKKEYDALAEERRQKEVKYMMQRQERRVEHERILEELRVQDAEEYNRLKMRLENEIQTLEQQLQEMRATYQLNTEKLEYNFRVLTERDAENQHTITHQKRMITKLQDVLSGLTAKYQKQDEAFRRENVQLTEDYKRITQQFKDLQKKFRHFRATDGKKLREVWEMNEERLSDLMRKVLEADKVLTEQQLGLMWEPPTEDVFTFHREGDGFVVAPTSTKVDREGQEEGGDDGKERMTQGDEKARERRKLAEQASSHTVMEVLRMLFDEAGFLMEDKIRKELVGKEQDEQKLIHKEAVFAALGVDAADDVEELVGYFLKEGSEEDPELIHPSNVIKALKAFVEDHRKTVEARGIRVGMTREEKIEMTRKEERLWCERAAGVISPKTARVWDALEPALKAYNEELKRRAQLMSENEGLAQQNEELRMLLSQYLASSVNDDLVVPPAQTMGLMVEEEKTSTPDQGGKKKLYRSRGRGEGGVKAYAFQPH